MSSKKTLRTIEMRFAETAIMITYILASSIEHIIILNNKYQYLLLFFECDKINVLFFTEFI